MVWMDVNQALIQRNVVMDKSVHNFYVYLCIVEPGNSYLTEYLALSSGKPKFEYLSAISHCRARGKVKISLTITGSNDIDLGLCRKKP